MISTLKDKKIAFLATDGFEQVELTKPMEEIKKSGAIIDLVSLKKGQIQGFNHTDKADKFDVDKTIDEVSASNYDGLVLPGGVHNPDILRTNKKAIAFIKGFFEAGKPVSAICHGPWTLIEADVVAGRTLTSWPSLKTDIENAGAHWVDKEVVCDNGLLTSRNPDDLDAFCKKTIEMFSEEKNYKQAA